jgi:hypothetical protein
VDSIADFGEIEPVSEWSDVRPAMFAKSASFWQNPLKMNRDLRQMTKTS